VRRRVASRAVGEFASAVFQNEDGQAEILPVIRQAIV
jgi:hypothetical protein